MACSADWEQCGDTTTDTQPKEDDITITERTITRNWCCCSFI